MTTWVKLDLSLSTRPYLLIETAVYERPWGSVHDSFKLSYNLYENYEAPAHVYYTDPATQKVYRIESNYLVPTWDATESNGALNYRDHVAKVFTTTLTATGVWLTLTGTITQVVELPTPLPGRPNPPPGEDGPGFTVTLGPYTSKYEWQTAGVTYQTQEDAGPAFEYTFGADWVWIAIDKMDTPVTNLFTTDADEVDLNKLADAERQIVAANPDSLYDALAGDDRVWLPNIANYQIIGTVVYESTRTFRGNDGEDFIVGGDGNDQIDGGEHNDTLFGAGGADVLFGGPGDDKLRGSSGADRLSGGEGDDTFDYQTFGLGILTGGVKHTLDGGSQTETGRDRIWLPGSASDYKITVQFNAADLSQTKTLIQPQDGSAWTLEMVRVEQASFLDRLSNPVGTQIFPTMEQALRTAEAVNAEYFYRSQALAWEPAFSDTVRNYQPIDLPTATATGWQPLHAIEVGMEPGAKDLNADGLRYSFVDGHYAAYELNRSFDPGTVYEDRSEAQAVVLKGLLGDEAALLIAFRGTDQLADWNDYANFATHYRKFAPLMDGLKPYIGNDIRKVIVTGEGLGAAMAQYFLHEFPGDGRFQAFLMGSPGGDFEGADERDTRIINFLNTRDVVAKIPLISGAGSSDDAARLVETYADQLKLYDGDASEAGQIAGRARIAEALTDVTDALRPKFHQGYKVFINSVTRDSDEVFDEVTDRSVAQRSSQYNLDLSILTTYARDEESPFAGSPLANTLLDGTPYLGADGFGRDLRITHGSSLDRSEKIEADIADNFILAGPGNDVIEVDDAASTPDTYRYIDGGTGNDLLVIFGHDRGDFSWHHAVADLSPYQLYFGHLYSADLHRMELLFLPDNTDEDPVTHVRQAVFRFDGSDTVVQTAPEGTTDVTVDPAADETHTPDGDVTTTGTSGPDTVGVGTGNQTVNGGDDDDIIYSDWRDAFNNSEGAQKANAAAAPSLSGMMNANGEGGNDLILGSPGHDLLNGGTGADDLYGRVGNDRLTGGAGNDKIDGGAGIDTAVFSGNRAAFSILRTGATTTVSGPDGVDTLTLVERLAFQDMTVSLGGSGNDFNGDNKSDVLFSQQGAVYASNYQWQMNDRAIAGQGAIDLYDKAFSVQVIGDYDADGKSDIVFQNPATGGVWMWLLDGTAIKSQGAIDVGDPAYRLLGAADFNGDGKADLLFRHDSGDLFMWRMNGIDNTPLYPGPLSSVWSIVGVGDFGGDGKADLLLRNTDPTDADNYGAYYLWTMDGKKIIGEGGIERPLDVWKTFAVGDFDGDGKTDFAVRNVSATGDNGAVWVYLMDGVTIKAQGAAGIADAAVWHVEEVGDLDGDGNDDILFRNDAGYFYSWNMNGTTIASEGLLQGAAQWADPAFTVVKPHWELV